MKQIAFKDSKYAATGDWGLGNFKMANLAVRCLHKICFCCHEPAKDRDPGFHWFRTLKLSFDPRNR
jgi:hypothetical protein